MKNILILGGGGFIGKNIVKKLLEDECKIIVTTRGTDFSLDAEYNSSKLIIRQAKISDVDLIKTILHENEIQIVIHLVSNLIPASKIEDFQEEMLEVIMPTFELINHLAEKKIQFVFFSSGGTIYGKSNDKIDEDHALEPITYYGQSKLIIENYIFFLARTKKLDYLIIRPSNAYGLHQRSNRLQGFIAVSLGKVISDLPVVIWGDGLVVRDYIHVLDLSEVVRLIIASGVKNEIFNVGSGQGVTLLWIVELIKNLLGKDVLVEFQEGRKVDSEKIILNVEKMHRFFGFQPRGIENGIKHYIDTLGLR